VGNTHKIRRHSGWVHAPVIIVVTRWTNEGILVQVANIKLLEANTSLEANASLAPIANDKVATIDA
jgi:hypothetical protein